MTFIPKPHEIYKHFKGNLYQVIAIAEHTETGGQLVVYQALYGDFKAYASSLSQFCSRVDQEEYPDVTQEFCFELQGPEAERQKKDSRFGEDSGKPVPSGAARPPEAGEEEASGAAELSAPGEEVPGLDPLVLEFLDADDYRKRLNILAALHHRITDDMITIMAIACDVEITDGDTEERYSSLKTCLQTLERYECNRIR